jgi:integrase/recombinase XerC
VNFEHLVDEFHRSRRRTGYSPATEHTYRGAFIDLRRSLEAQGADPDRLSEWEPRHIDAWQDGQVDRLKPNSRAMRATAVRQLLEWAERQDLPVKHDLWRAVSRVRVPRGQPRPLSEDDLRKLLAYLARKWPGIVDKVHARDRALLLYLIGSAGRISEVLQVRRDEYQAAVVVRKGGGEGMLMIPAVVVAAVEAYLATRKDDLPWLWVGLTRGIVTNRLTAEGVRHICDRLSRKAGIPHFSPHQLRHTSATTLLDAGIQEAVIANHLGHHGLGTLANYAEVRPKRRAEALSAMETALGGQVGATSDPRDELIARLAATVARLESRLQRLESGPLLEVVQ